MRWCKVDLSNIVLQDARARQRTTLDVLNAQQEQGRVLISAPSEVRLLAKPEEKCSG